MCVVPGCDRLRAKGDGERHGPPSEEILRLRPSAVAACFSGNRSATGRSIWHVWCQHGHQDEVVPGGGTPSNLPSGDWSEDRAHTCPECRKEVSSGQ